MKQREFGFKLKIDGDISDILDSLKALQAAFDKVEMPDSLTKALTKDINTAIQKVGEFGKKSESAINSLSDSKEIANAWKSVQKELNALEVKLEGIDSSKLFPKEVTANLNKATQAAEEYVRALESSKNSDDFKKKLEELNRITEQQRANESLRKKARQSELQTEAIYSQKKAQWTDQINQQYEEQQAAVVKTNQSLEQQKIIVKQLLDEQTKLQKEGYLTTQNKPFSKKNEAAKQLSQAESEVTSAEYSRRAAKGAVTRYENKNSGKNLKKDQEYLALKQKLTSAENKHAEALKKVEQLKEEIGDSKKLNRANEIGAEIAQARELQKALEGQASDAKIAASDLEKQKSALDQAKNAYTDAAEEAAGYDAQLEKLGEESEKLNQDLRNIQTDSAKEEWKTLVKIVKEFTGIDLSESAQDMDAFMDAINQYKQGAIDKLPETLKEILANAKPIPEAVGRIGGELNELGDDVDSATRAANEMENLKNQVLDFFSISNSIQLFKRAVSSALETVKQLDATMTEAAVVTEFDIGDMWEKLPEYSQRAQDLGVAINDMYGATTLYYQQGLKTNAAMELGAETMKMGKIAAMDSTEATKAMTAALRGFNMELNETSAVRVNDVYSQLAAVTAADTNQIATAMEKTASIAASANMEFETTAAFLSQIIETTQEAPETAGTALKTIIARFAEVKSLREQGLTSGEDDEGEIIDVNKIQTALRTVGISMEGFFNGTEGLDSILLKLSEKWGSLDFETQRYIATMAAGSRQQSRFIAMMSDYGRTTELVGAAQNSAGASQKQFEKTQESLATSLTKLKNAWDEFLMGLANNEALKFGVDTLTSILETVNKLTSALSGDNGLVKSLFSLVGVISALKGGKNLLGGIGISTNPLNIVGKYLGASQKGTEKKTQSKNNSIKYGSVRNWKKTTSSIEFSDESITSGIEQAAKRLEKDASSAAFKIKELNKELKEGKITAQEAKAKYEELGGTVDDLGEAADKTSWDFNAIGQSATVAGMAMMGAGAACSMLAAAFESWGMEEEAEALQNIGAIVMGIGSGLTTLGQILPVVTKLMAKFGVTSLASLGWIALILAAIVGLVALTAAALKSAHENSIEGRMEAVAEATERAKEAAETANQAYEDLLSAKSGYNELQNQLDTLTKGTLEWKKALVDSNAQVLELLDKYPELTKYLTRGEHGELEISEEGWGVVEKYQTQAIKNSSSMVIVSQMEEAKLQKEKAKEDLLSSKYTSNDEDTMAAIYKKYVESNGMLFAEGADSIGLKELSEEVRYTTDILYNMKDAIIAYDQALINSEIALQAQSEALLSNTVSEEVASGEYGQDLITGMAAGFTKNQDSLEKGIYDKIYHKDGESDSKNNEYFQQLMIENGLTANDMTGNDEKDLEILYAKMAGIKVDEIGAELKGDKKALAQEIAEMQAAKEAGKETDRIYKHMSKLDKDTQRDYAALISKDIGKVDRGFISKFKDIETLELNKMASDLGFESVAAMAESFGFEGDIEKMKQEFQLVAQEAVKEFEKISKAAKSRDIKIDDKEPLKKATAKQLQSYVNLMTTALSSGETKAALESGFSYIFSKTNEAQQEKIMALMETFNWAEEGQTEAFVKALEEMGIVLGDTPEAVEAFVKATDKANAFYRNFNLTDILDSAKSELEEIENIAKDGYISTEQFQKFIEDGTIEKPEEWSWNGKGWVNITNGMDTLVQALKENTVAQLKLTKEEAQEQVSTYYNRKGLIDAYFKNEKPVEKPNGQVQFDDFKGGINWDQVKSSFYTGTADKDLWGQFFASKEEYDQWIKLNNGDIKNAEFVAKNFNFDENAILTGGGAEEKKKDPYDKYYNYYEQLNTIIKLRERLEKRRNALLEKRNTTEAKQNRQQQRDYLAQEKAKQEFLAREKKAELDTLKNQSIAQKAGLEIDENGTIKFDQTTVNSWTGDTREKFDDLLSKIEEVRDQMREAQDASLDIEIDINELDKEDRSAYIDITNRIKDAIVSERQEEIDRLKEINDSINDTNSKILNSMQEQLSESRQARDNEKTEQELSDKQRRLAYLQQDTSGANAMEIMQLQKEIEEGQESYTDQLIDQKISELQKQNDQAAEQRAKQIEILESQLAWDKENGNLWAKVTEYMTGAVDANGNINENSALINLLKKQEGFNALSPEQQEEFIENFRIALNKALSYDKSGTGSSSSSGSNSSSGSSGGANSSGSSTSGSSSSSGVTSGSTGSTTKYPKPSDAPGTLARGSTGDYVKGLQEFLRDKGYYNGEIDGKFGPGTEAAVKKFQTYEKGQGRYSDNIDGRVGPKTKQALRYYSYQTGGLADFTGPAWLDGTKSKPEYILNAEQTKAFFNLVDVLSSLQGGGSKTAQISGDNSFDIDINVESIGSDYDVEQMADKVMDIIVSTSRYRNNNTL